MAVEFKLEKRPHENGEELATIIKYEDGKEVDQWCTIMDLDRLFDTCSRRWAKHGWDLNKLIACVSECEFD